MMNELPQVSSTTSLSDNPQLRQYYDKFLFKNSSGKSLSDLPAKAREQAREQTRSNLNPGDVSSSAGGGAASAGSVNYGAMVQENPENSNFENNGSQRNMDFISGFRNPLYHQPDPSPSSSAGQNVGGLSFGDSAGSMPGSSSMFQFGVNGLAGSQGQQQPFGMVPLSESVQQGLPPHDYGAMGGAAHQQMMQQQLQGSAFDPGMQAVHAQAQAQMQSQGGQYQMPMGHPHSRNNSVVSNSSVSPSSYYAALNQTVSPTSQLSPLSSAGGSSYGAGTVTPSNLPFGQDPANYIRDLYSSGRRSSYVSDALIHGHSMNNQNSTFSIGGGNISGNAGPGGSGGNVGGGNNQQRFFQQQRQSVSGTASAGVSGYQPSRNFQQMKHNSVSSGSNGPVPSNMLPLSGQQQHSYQHSQQQQQLAAINSNSGSNPQAISAGLPQQGTFPLDNGLMLRDGQITSSPSLVQLYKECGENFFASKQCHEFVDSVKALVVGKSDNNERSKKVQKFLGFLKNCNLNYNPQSDAFVSTGKHRRSSTSSYLHYRPLVLVALKNGKLELLSLPQATNLSLARDDLVIIDGDRGKDLAVCIDPVVDLELALFINFLKKKIHFDSLITSRSQHYPAGKFIDALMNNANGSQDDLNPKLYDVIELTQLIIPSKQILRFATPWECSTNLHSKFQDELKALHISQLKLKTLNSNNAANGKPGLNIKILNSEFQFDRKKLTFYYICQERNDFRELIKELFKFYKTRIWLCAIPNNLGIDSKYYDNEKKEWAMYKDMMKHFQQEELIDNNLPPQTGFIVAPSLDKIQLDNFQIGVYIELVNSMF